MKSKIKRQASGQSLVEYALVMVLVAVVAIVALFAVGLATQQGFGLVGGALGINKSTNPGVLSIDRHECGVSPSAHTTYLYVTGTTNVPQADISDKLMARVDNDKSQAIVNGVQGSLMTAKVFAQGGDTWRWNPTISDTVADLSLCPVSVIVQVSNGTLAMAPIVKVSVP